MNGVRVIDLAELSASFQSFYSVALHTTSRKRNKQKMVFKGTNEKKKRDAKMGLRVDTKLFIVWEGRR